MRRLGGLLLIGVGLWTAAMPVTSALTGGGHQHVHQESGSIESGDPNPESTHEGHVPVPDEKRDVVQPDWGSEDD